MLDGVLVKRVLKIGGIVEGTNVSSVELAHCAGRMYRVFFFFNFVLPCIIV